jgi:phosphohistidine phosphatase
MKKLLLMRHAKSSWKDPEFADQDRPLNARGRKGAGRIGKYLKDSILEPSIVLCSSAVRARQTLELLRPALPDSTTVKIEPRLYSAGSKELVTRVRRLSQTAPSVLIVGHNPAIQELVLTLASEDPRSDEIRKKFPTAALAVFDAQIEEWKHLEPDNASLVDFVTPKGLRG